MNKFNLFDPQESIGAIIEPKDKYGPKDGTVVVSVKKNENSVRLNFVRHGEYMDIFKLQDDEEILCPNELIGHTVHAEVFGHSFSGLVYSVDQDNLCVIRGVRGGEYQFLRIYK
ncbi:MAG: hypothetical protein II507_12905 [Treponema sp.]|nr:hypothetical protein [Treponema sp.]MBQ2465864.1 hypothetical protein [Treponema sp.]